MTRNIGLTVFPGWLELFFMFFLIYFLFCFVFQYIVDWEVNFIIYYDSLSVELSQSNDLGHEFYRLIRVGLCWTNMSSSPCFLKEDVQYVIISIFIKDVDQYAPYFSTRKHVWDALTFCLHFKKTIWSQP
jgi:hypothetical protein